MNYFLHDNRITADYDFENELKLSFYILKGILLLKKLPSKIRQTERGYHVIFSGIDTSDEKRFTRRLQLGDDKNRIRLDRSSEKRQKQVLFSEKTVTTFGYMHPVWFKIVKIESPSKHFNVCPFCHKKISQAKKIWTDELRAIQVFHKNSQHICEYKLRMKPLPTIIKLLKKTGTEVVT
jgi:hypothetical protein